MKSLFRLSYMGIKILALAFILIVPFNTLLSQDQDEAHPKKAKARISLSFYNNLNNGAYLEAIVKSKVQRSYKPVPGETINFYLVNQSDSLLGKVITDDKGTARLPIDNSLIQPDDDVHIHVFKAAIENSEKFRNATTELEVAEASMEVDFKGDSVHQVSIRLTTLDSAGNRIPVSGEFVKLYVQRMFSNLPVGDEEFPTDDAGEVVLGFPDDIPGDQNGMLRVIVKLENHELFGNLIFEKDVNWGTPVTERDIITKGEIWASRANAPMWLVILVNVILVGIWGTIAYIVYQLIKISKIKCA